MAWLCADGVGQPQWGWLPLWCRRVLTRAAAPAGLRWRELLATAARWTAAPASTRAVLTLAAMTWRAKLGGSRETLSIEERTSASGYH